ncbi:MAG: hypothetical protein ACK47H_00715, partial [Akkermansiaceae bacterium]
PGWFVFSEVTLPGSAGSSTHHADEEEVAHNSPLLRRGSDPFSNRPGVGNFQELRADLKRSEASFNPQILRKRQKRDVRQHYRRFNHFTATDPL